MDVIKAYYKYPAAKILNFSLFYSFDAASII